MTGRAIALVLTLFGLAAILAEANAYDPFAKTAWSVDRRMDPIRGTLDITAILPEAGVESSTSATQYGKHLVVRYRRQHLMVFVSWGRYGVLGSGRSGHDVSHVTTRFDTGMHQVGSWSRSTDDAATFAPRPHQLLRLIRQHRRLFVWTQSGRGDPLSAVFELSGARPIVQDVLDACAPCPAHAR